MYLISDVTQYSKYGNWCILKSFRFLYKNNKCINILLLPDKNSSGWIKDYPIHRIQSIIIKSHKLYF